MNLKKIIPFKKDIIFKTNLYEIISISLDHELNIEDNLVKGKFIVSGEYKMLEKSINSEPFSYDIPFTVDLDEKYILDNALIDIDDFYYEIINDNVLKVGIDVLIDNIEEKDNVLIRKSADNIEDVNGRCVEEETKPPKKEKNDVVYNDESNETYKSYTVYILRDHDSIDDIISKYDTTKEQLEKIIYNIFCVAIFLAPIILGPICALILYFGN